MIPTSEQSYWTLPQAAAWVVFRNMTVVDLFSAPDPESWVAYMAYPTMRRADRIGEQLDVFKALQDGRLTATGRRPVPEAMREEIPAIDWLDLIADVDGPYRRLETGARHEPWRDIMLRRADVERLWRRPTEVQGRTKFDKSWFRNRFTQLRAAHPEFSMNELIEEVSGQFRDEMRRGPPSRTTIQRYIKDL